MLPQAVQKAHRCGDTRHAGTSRGRNARHVRPAWAGRALGPERARTRAPLLKKHPWSPFFDQLAAATDQMPSFAKCSRMYGMANVTVTMPCSRYNAGIDQALSIFFAHSPATASYAPQYRSCARTRCRGPLPAKRNVLPRSAAKGGAAHVVLKVILCRANRVAHDLVRQIAPHQEGEAGCCTPKLQQIRRPWVARARPLPDRRRF